LFIIKRGGIDVIKVLNLGVEGLLHVGIIEEFFVTNEFCIMFGEEKLHFGRIAAMGKVVL
jgi:hypothetical protein